MKKVLLDISRNSYENASVRVNFIKKETLAQVLSCEFCEILRKPFLTEHLWVTAPGSFSLPRDPS